MNPSVVRDLSEIESIAVVSGKGGSGKTLVATALAQSMSAAGQRVLLIDADLGTGGLTYYLGFSLFQRARLGLVEFLTGKAAFDKIHAAPRDEAVRAEPSLALISIVPVGQHRLTLDQSTPFARDRLSDLIRQASAQYDLVIFDCRGGIDHDSVAVCRAADAVLIVAETDAASIQTTQHLVDELSKHEIQQKVVGFVLNKVMDDPTSLATAGLTFFRCDYLGPIPFDIEVTRSFIKGEAPLTNSLFARHVFRAASRIFDGAKIFDNVPVLRAADFSTITLQNPDASRGAVVIGLIMLYLVAFYLLAAVFHLLPWGDLQQHVVFALGLLLFTAAQSAKIKQRFGEGLRSYLRVLPKFR